jgi:replication factor A1
MQNYELLIERIAKSSGLDVKEIEKRIEAKKAKLSGLISKEGAAQIVAAELGVSFDNVQLKISELMPGMKKVNLLGKVITLFPVREYNKNNRQGKIGSFIVADETANLRVVLWDTNHIKLIEKNEIEIGSVVEIKNAFMRENELHLSGFSEIKLSNLKIDNIKTERSSTEKLIKDLQENQNVKLRGIVVQLFNPRFFHVCSECGKKVSQEPEGFICAEHGRNNARERALINFVLDDGTETLRVVLFSDQISKIAVEEDLKDPEKMLAFRDDFLGTEVFITGVARRNQLFNNLELNASDISKVDVDKLIEVLEKN